MEKICQYRNCNNIIGEEKRKDAKFCCRACKTMERTYVKRKAALLDKYKEEEMKKVNNIKKLMFLIKGGTQI